MRYNIDNERQETPKGTSRKEINTMIKVYFNGLTEYGSCIYDAVVFVPEDLLRFKNETRGNNSKTIRQPFGAERR